MIKCLQTKEDVFRLLSNVDLIDYKNYIHEIKEIGKVVCSMPEYKKIV